MWNGVRAKGLMEDPTVSDCSLPTSLGCFVLPLLPRPLAKTYPYRRCEDHFSALEGFAISPLYEVRRCLWIAAMIYNTPFFSRSTVR